MTTKILAAALLLVLAATTPALAVQRLQVACTPSPTGDPATSYLIEREAGGGTGAWDATKATAFPAQLVGAPPLVDRTGVAGVPYRMRCTSINAAGPSTPSNPSGSFTLAGVPGQPGVTVIIISE